MHERKIVFHVYSFPPRKRNEFGQISDVMSHTIPEPLYLDLDPSIDKKKSEKNVDCLTIFSMKL
jgi:hypothetical protein